jgi:hypothetical protein
MIITYGVWCLRSKSVLSTFAEDGTNCPNGNKQVPRSLSNCRAWVLCSTLAVSILIPCVFANVRWKGAI